MSGYASARFDFAHPTQPTRIYVVAASYRSGSTHLCLCLWQTGALGAPWEYLNYEGDTNSVMARLNATSPSDYTAQLMRRRTSPNGVFGVKAHFEHFDSALSSFPELKTLLRNATFIYMQRHDRLAQAVSLAKALQTNAWISLSAGRRVPLFYSAEFIAACLEQISAQIAGWTRWFEANDVTPLVVRYEDLVADRSGVIRQVMKHVGAGDAGSREVVLPWPGPQSDQVNAEWMARFRAEHRAGDAVGALAAEDGTG